MPVSSDPPCQKEACAIQDCLTARGFQETRCVDVIDALYVCCSKLNGQKSTACPKPSVVLRKLLEKEERDKGR